MRPTEQVRAGIAAIARLPETQLLQRSSFYRSAPIGDLDQPEFINAVCEVETAMTPETLMRSLLEIESSQGRVRAVPGGPRTLDLDLLLYDDVALATPVVTLPHPRLHERAFVLYPLSEIAPVLTVPGRGSVAELLRACAGQTIERLPMDSN